MTIKDKNAAMKCLDYILETESDSWDDWKIENPDDDNHIYALALKATGDWPESKECKYCGSADCEYNCDESKAGGFNNPFTVVGFYTDNNQVFVFHVEANAAEFAIDEAKKKHADQIDNMNFCEVFEGHLQGQLDSEGIIEGD
jgi:hypothetical protein